MMRALLVLALLALSFAWRLWTHATDGTIEFGAGYVPGSIIQRDHVAQARTAFGPHDTMNWVAHVSDHIGATMVTQSIAQIEPDGTERPVSTEMVPLATADATDLHGTQSVSDWRLLGLTAPGAFVMRYYRRSGRGDTLLAQGTFTLTH